MVLVINISFLFSKNWQKSIRHSCYPHFLTICKWGRSKLLDWHKPWNSKFLDIHSIWENTTSLKKVTLHSEVTSIHGKILKILGWYLFLTIRTVDFWTFIQFGIIPHHSKNLACIWFMHFLTKWTLTNLWNREFWTYF